VVTAGMEASSNRHAYRRTIAGAPAHHLSDTHPCDPKQHKLVASARTKVLKPLPSPSFAERHHGRARGMILAVILRRKAEPPRLMIGNGLRKVITIPKRQARRDRGCACGFSATRSKTGRRYPCLPPKARRRVS
jgi:hypothetical protein